MIFLLLSCVHSNHGPTPIVTGAEKPARAELLAGCERGEVELCLGLARGLADGTWEARDVPAALRIFEDQCNQKSTMACGMGLLLLQKEGGSSVPANPLQEENFTENACSGGISEACMMLGRRWVEEDPTRAQEAWRRACAAAPNGYTCGLVDGSWPARVPEQPILPPDFQAELSASGMTFTLPPRFHPVPVVPNPSMAYQYAIQDEKGTLEVRYQVKSLAPMIAEYQDCQKKPNCTSIAPNRFGEAMLTSTAFNIAADPTQVGDPESLPDIPQRLEFGGTWGQLLVIHPRPNFTESKAVMLYGFHRDDVADAMVAVLFSDPKVVMDTYAAAFHALRWKDPVGL